MIPQVAKAPARQSEGSVDADGLLVAMIEDAMRGPVAVGLGAQALCFAGLLGAAEHTDWAEKKEELRVWTHGLKIFLVEGFFFKTYMF